MRPWRIRFLDRTWTHETCTVAQLVLVAEMVGDTWAAVDPWSTPRALTAWLTVCVATASGSGLDEAVALVNAMAVSQLLDVLDDGSDEGVT